MIKVEPQVEFLWATPDSDECLANHVRMLYRDRNRPNDTDSLIRTGIRCDLGDIVLSSCQASFRIYHSLHVLREISTYIPKRVELSPWGSMMSDEGVQLKHLPFVMPKIVRDTGRGESHWKQAVENGETAFFGMLRDGLRPDAASTVLPLSLASTTVFTAGFDEWIKLLDGLQSQPMVSGDVAETLASISFALSIVSPILFARGAEKWAEKSTG